MRTPNYTHKVCACACACACMCVCVCVRVCACVCFCVRVLVFVYVYVIMSCGLCCALCFLPFMPLLRVCAPYTSFLSGLCSCRPTGDTTLYTAPPSPPPLLSPLQVGRTPLHWLAQFSGPTSGVDTLVDAGADVEARDRVPPPSLLGTTDWCVSLCVSVCV